MKLYRNVGRALLTNQNQGKNQKWANHSNGEDDFPLCSLSSAGHHLAFHVNVSQDVPVYSKIPTFPYSLHLPSMQGSWLQIVDTFVLTRNL